MVGCAFGVKPSNSDCDPSENLGNKVEGLQSQFQNQTKSSLHNHWQLSGRHHPIVGLHGLCIVVVIHDDWGCRVSFSSVDQHSYKIVGKKEAKSSE